MTGYFMAGKLIWLGIRLMGTECQGTERMGTEKLGCGLLDVK